MQATHVSDIVQLVATCNQGVHGHMHFSVAAPNHGLAGRHEEINVHMLVKKLHLPSTS